MSSKKKKKDKKKDKKKLNDIAKKLGFKSFGALQDKVKDSLDKKAKDAANNKSNPPSGNTSGSTFSLKDSSGKVVGTYNAADKQSMERMGLARGYSFSPSSGGGQNTNPPQTASPSTPQSTATNLYSYYTQQGKSLPSPSARFNDPAFASAAKAAGITQQNYTGDENQNKAILQNLKSSGSQNQNNVQTNPQNPVTPKPGDREIDATIGTISQNADGTYSVPVVGASGQAITINVTQERINSLWKTNPALARQYGFPPATAAPEETEETYNEETSQDSPDMEGVDYDTSPVILGDQTLVKYQNHYWLVDKKEKTIRPFASMEAFNQAYGDNALMAADIADSQAIDDNAFGSLGNFKDYAVLDFDFAVQGDGTMKEYDNSISALKTRYNKAISEENETSAYWALDGFMDILAQDTSGISKDTLEKIEGDPKKVAFYISALAYGGYTLDDVYRDLKKDELGLSSTRPISASEERNVYINTSKGKLAQSNSELMPPTDLGGLTPEIMSLPIYSMPDEAFSILKPLLDFNSPEFQARIDEMGNALHDVLMQQLNAQNDQDKAIADYNWQSFKSEAEKTLGITLGDNAYEAWNQLEGVRGQFSGRGILNSGIQQEAVDKYLRQIRLADSRNREEVKTQKEEEQRKFFINYASSDEIKKMVDEDKAAGLAQNEWRATKWGLTPSDDVKGELSAEKLKEKYPELDEDQINDYISVVLDENGNYRSSLYQNFFTKKRDEKERLKTYNTQLLLDEQLDAEEKAYEQYTQPDIAFLRTEGDIVTPDMNQIDLPMPTQRKNLKTKFTQPTDGVTGKTDDLLQQENAEKNKVGSMSVTRLYRDPNGNIVNDKGGVVMSSKQVAGDSTWASKLAGLPAYSAGTSNPRPGSGSGTSAQGSATKKYVTSTGLKIDLTEDQFNTIKKNNPTLASGMKFL